MDTFPIILISGLLLAGLLLLHVWRRQGMRWGASDAECAKNLAGDLWLTTSRAARVRMTRAITIHAPPDKVWPWIAQLGRGAGWYSLDFLDNGGKSSARHIVSWIPPVHVGDAAAIGYLTHIDPGRELVWWLPGERLLGAETRMVFDLHISPENGACRLLIRISADARGMSARCVLWLFSIIDTLMARPQLLGIKHRAEAPEPEAEQAKACESGRRDQYQHYEVIYACGSAAGTPGKEKAAHWRQIALDEKICPNPGHEAPHLRENSDGVHNSS